MSHTQVDPYTLLTYLVEKIFNVASVKSNYRARSIKLPDGKSITDVVLNDNDRDIFNTFLPQVATLVFEPISVLSQGVTDGFTVDMVGGSSNEPQVGFKFFYNNNIPIVNKEGEEIARSCGYDMNQLPVMDTYVFDALVVGCLIRWCAEIGLFDESAYQQRAFDDLIRNIRTSVLYRKADGRTKTPYRTI